MADSNSSLGFIPRPVTHITRGSYGAGKKGDLELNASLSAAQSQMFQWIVYGQETHARKVMTILDAWSENLFDFAGNDAMLLGGWTGGAWANIGEILRATWKAWPAASQAAFEKMLRTVYVPLLHPFFPEANGNWDAAMMHSLLAIAVYCEDESLFDHVIRHYKFGSGTSGITRYVYPNGQCEESARDQGHTQLGLGYLAITCQIAWNQGMDLFSEADNRLALGFEYTSRYMLGEDVFAYGKISPEVRGRFDDCYALPLQHFRYGGGIQMPYTEKAMERSLARSNSILSFYQGRSSSVADYPTPSPSRVAFEAGATIESQKLRGIVVQPGESIQQAIHDCPKGEQVALAAGLHELQTALVIPSGTWLCGVGRATVLFMEASKTGPGLTNQDMDLKDVTLENFLIEAGTAPHPSRDPNQDRRSLSSQLAQPRGGILFSTDHGHRIRNIRLKRITVRNATTSAVDIFLGEQITIERCDFSASGGAVAPGPGKHHCLNLSMTTEMVISGSRLVDSLQGCGICLTFCKSLQVRDCEIARNQFDGIKVVESSDISISDSLIEGNSREAVGRPRLMRGSSNVSISANVIRNNGSGETSGRKRIES